MQIVPLGDRVLVKPLEEVAEQAKGKILIPDTAKEKPQEGEVIAVGDGKLLDSGQKVPLQDKKGDKVLFPKYGGSEVKIDGVDYLIIREEDILGIVK